MTRGACAKVGSDRAGTRKSAAAEGCRTRWALAKPAADASRVARVVRGSNRLTSSSSTKTPPAIGALNAVARPAAAQHAAHDDRDRAAHLHRGPLPPEREARADGQQTADVLHREDAEAPRR